MTKTKIDKVIKLVIYSNKETTAAENGVSFGIVKIKAFGGEVDKLALPVEDEQNVNYMDLFCFRYAIAALTGNEGCSLEIHSKNDWFRRMFDYKDGEWVHKPTGLKDVVSHLRTLVEESGFIVSTRKLHTQESNSLKKESLKLIEKLNNHLAAEAEHNPEVNEESEEVEGPEAEIDTNKLSSMDDDYDDVDADEEII